MSFPNSGREFDSPIPHKMKKIVLIMFGGVSAEHEVSVVTGLQVAEQIDRTLYEPLVIYVDKSGTPFLLGDISSRKQFLKSARKQVTFGKDERGGFVKTEGLAGKKYYPYAAYFAFHGGSGEGGDMQGLCEAFDIPFSSPGQEGSVIAMNKKITKTLVSEAGVPVVPAVSVSARQIKENSKEASSFVIKEINLPVIIKPAHLGSSIGIKIARTETELEKFLIESSRVDSEILIEKLLDDFTEYNCSVRQVKDKLETSEIERPISHDEILSFADKYQRGGKKSGQGGMANLARELPAKISMETKNKIQSFAKKAFEACRLKGMVRIDFMETKTGELYLSEINSIPGSMSFYLWEASGISFKEQISDLIEQSVLDFNTTKNSRLDYESDIIEKFVNS